MSSDKPYLIVLFEDGAYQDFFNGFRSHIRVTRQIHAKPVLKGVEKIKHEISDEKSITLKEMKKYEAAILLVLIDSDKRESRVQDMMERVPDFIRDRIFIISSAKNAEKTNSFFGGGKKEKLGWKLAESCINGACELWREDPLAHNVAMIERFQQKFPSLFT